MPDVSIGEIPDELKERAQWLLWTSDPEQPKRPHWRGDFNVSWTDPDDWHGFEEAVEAALERDSWGIGYCFANTNDDHPAGIYGALDLDGCAEDGSPKDWLPSLQPFFDEDAYLEFSPSGEGIHIPLVGFEPPEWWSNVWFTDEEHEGVEAYGKKFFTFTGDRLRNAGESVADTGEYVEDWLIEAHKSITGEDPTKQQSADFEDASDGGRANREEFLEEEDVRDALDHVDPDVDYNTWRDVGFALADFFPRDHTPLFVFEDWSKSGSKWGSDAEKQAERIINDASSGGGRTIGTVIHLARSGGWEMPSGGSKNPPPPPPQPPESDGDDDEERTDDGTPSWEISWEEVRDVYEDEDNKWGRLYAAQALDNRYSWMFVMESETLWVFDEDRGYFNRWGEQFAANLLEEKLGNNYSVSEKKEIIARLQARHQTHREELNARSRAGYFLCVGNGVIDLTTGELRDHDPSFKFTRGLKWEYDPARADPEPVVEFLDDITKREEDRDTLLDHLAHGLMPGHPYRAFVITYGPGSNGKTQMGQLFRGFVGEDNAASVELQDLTGDDNFATGGLPGAFVNVGDDISVSEIRDVSILKSLTGGGTVRANEKYEKQYEFQNEAAMFFSANEPPRISEESDAIGDRLYPIEMPFRFVDDDAYDPENPRHKKKTPGISQRLLEDEAAMQGLLLLCVKHAQELIDSNGRYSMPEGPRQRREIYEAASDPIRRFALECLETGESSDVLLKDDAFAVYREMCERQNERIASADGFKRQITQQALIDVESAYTRKFSTGDDREACWRYVSFNEDAKQLMPARLVSRYFGEEAVDDTEGEEMPENREDVPFHATPIREVAREPTGYGTVTVDVLVVEAPDNENTPAMKATVQDASGVVDVVSWDDSSLLEEDQTYVIMNAEVTEYQSKHQLTIRDGITEIQEIQAGVGYSKGSTPSEGQQDLDTAADGGADTATADGEDQASPSASSSAEEPETASEGDVPQADAVPMALQFVRSEGPVQSKGVPHQEVVDELVQEGVAESTAEYAIQTLLEKGGIQEPVEGHYKA